MTLLLLLLTVAVVGGVAAVASGAITGGLDDPVTTVPARTLPQGPPTPRDISALKFVPALRGYRMDQVDAAMDRLATEVERLHREIAERDRRLEMAGVPGFAAGGEGVAFGEGYGPPPGAGDGTAIGPRPGARAAGADEADDPGDTEAEHGPATGGFTPRPARETEPPEPGTSQVAPGPPEGFGPSWRQGAN